MRIRQRHLRKIARRFWGLLFSVIISLAVVVQFLREAFPLLNDYRVQIGDIVGESLNVEVELGRVEAVWSGMRPRIRLLDVVLSSPGGEEVLSVKEMRAELGLLDSLWEGELAWRQLAFDGVEAALEKSDEGRWRIRGLGDTPRKRDKPFNFDDPLDIFLIGRYVSLSNVNIDAYFPSGLQTQLNISHITLDNDEDFHRIVAQVGVDGEQESLKLILEGHGDPRVPADFDAAGYVSIHEFPMERVIAALPGKLWRAENGAWREGHRLNMQLWFDGNYEKGLSVSGELSAQGVPVNVPDYLKLPVSYHTKILGEWGAKQGFNLQLKDFLAQWQDFSAPALDIRILGKTPKYFELGAMDIAAWHQVLVKMGLDKSKIGNNLVNTYPKGQLQNISVQLTNKKQGYFSLRAHLLDGSLQAYENIPEFQHVNAVVDVNGNGGTAYIRSEEGLVLGLPRVFEKPFTYERAEGRINWHLDWQQRIAYLGSGLLTLENQGEVGKGFLHLTLPFNSDYGEAKMTLSVGVAEARLASFRDYLPTTIPPDLHQWLAQSVGEQGSMSNVQFLFNGSMESDPEVDPVVQLIAEVEGGDLAFDEAWPPLKDVNASLYMDNDQLNVAVNRARILGNSVSDSSVTLVENPHDKQGGQALLIYGAMESDAAAAMALLQNSPVRETLGSTFDEWTLSGDVSAQLKLFVPLEDEALGMHQRVNVRFSQASIDMRDIELQFNELRGSFQYDSDTGISAKRLDGKVWGRAIQANIESPKVGVAEDGTAILDTQINFRGDVDVADVKRWTLRPELEFMAGVTPVEGRLILPGGDTADHSVRIQMNSGLEGISFNLPEPFAKPAAQKKLFSLDLQFFDDYEAYDFNYDNFVRLRLHSAQTLAEEAMQLSFGPTQLDLTPGYFDVVGALPKIDVLAWDEVYDEYFAYVDQMAAEAGAGSEEPSLPMRVDLDIAECSLEGTVAKDVNIGAHGDDDLWEIDIASELVSGKVKIFADDALPVIMDLDYLHIPEDEIPPEALVSSTAQSEENDKALPEAEPAQQEPILTDTLLKPELESFEPLDTSETQVPTEVDISEASTTPAMAESVLADIDLADAIPVDFKVTELSYGGKYLGNWRFNLRPFDGGIILKNIHGDARGVHVNENKGGGQFIWTQDERGNRSSFIGNVKVDRGGEVLEAWDYERILDARSTWVEAKVTWEGAPDEVSLENIKGDVLFSMKDGNFIRGAQQGENPLLRLIALFNFDTIARRLRLDFSDLAKEGFAFDEVSAEFEFADGKLFLHDPVIVDSSSSKMQLAGIVDVINEEIDAQLVVTLPVAGDLTLATALVAGLPAAVGVFVVSKIFRKQVDKASSINYQVSGAWVDPKIKFKRIFDDSAARKKAEEVKGRGKNAAKSKPDTKLEQSPLGNEEVQVYSGENSAGETAPLEDLSHEHPAPAVPAKVEAKNEFKDMPTKPQVKASVPGEDVLTLEENSTKVLGGE